MSDAQGQQWLDLQEKLNTAHELLGTLRELVSIARESAEFAANAQGMKLINLATNYYERLETAARYMHEFTDVLETLRNQSWVRELCGRSPVKAQPQSPQSLLVATSDQLRMLWELYCDWRGKAGGLPASAGLSTVDDAYRNAINTLFARQRALIEELNDASRG